MEWRGGQAEIVEDNLDRKMQRLGLSRESSKQQTRRSETARSTSTSACIPISDGVDSERSDRLNWRHEAMTLEKSDHFDGRRFVNPTGSAGQPFSAVPRMLLEP